MFFWDEDANRLKKIEDSMIDMHSRLNSHERYNLDDHKHLKDSNTSISSKMDVLSKMFDRMNIKINDIAELQEIMSNTISLIFSLVEDEKTVKNTKEKRRYKKKVIKLKET